VGTYTREDSEGIYIYDYDALTGDLRAIGSARADNPSFLAVDPGAGRLYAVNELGEFDGSPTGSVSAFAIDRATGALTLLNQRASKGQAPAHISLDQDGGFAYVANYSSGTATVFPIAEDGALMPASDTVQHEGSGPDLRRQQGPHAHSATLDPSGQRVYVADLGIDRVMIYDVAAEPGKLVANQPAYAEVTGGSGPRHFAFHPNAQFAYLINEMGNTITAFAYDPETGALTEIQTVSTLPEGFEGRNTTADIHVHPNGRYLYGSNRGHDSIVVFAVAEDGNLTRVEHVSSGGRTPRNFAIDPSGNFLLAANQDSDNIVVFRIDPSTGQLTSTGVEVRVSMPVCVMFAAW
jgi:6-phosphogluconolactonase